MLHPRVPLLHRTLNVLIALFGLGHLYAAFHPSVDNWGFHALAFGTDTMKWLIPGLMLMLAIPRVQSLGLRVVRSAGGTYLRLTRKFRGLTVAVAIALLGVGFMLFHSAGIPGDGQFLINNMYQIKKPTDIAHVYLHEPLTCLIHWLLAWCLAGEITPSSAEMSYRIISILCGLAFLPILAAVIRRVVPGRTDRMLAFLFVLGSGSSLLFFGHIENYTIAFLGILVFLHFSLKFFAGETTLIAPSVTAGVLIPLYFGMVCILPALGYLFIVEYRKTRSVRSLLFPSGAFLVVCLGLLGATGFTPERFAFMLTGGGKHLIGLLEPTGPMEGYTLFSARHLIDLANLILLISPFGLFFIIGLSTSRGSVAGRAPPGVTLISILSISTAIVIILFRCDLGMPRDWDLLAPFMLGSIFLSILFLVRRVSRGENRRTVFFASAAVTLVHIVPWILLDHDPLQAIPQNRMILDQTTWIEGIHKGYEGLAMSAKRRGEYDAAAVLYHKFLAGDSSHPRILGNLADVYRLLGKEDSELVYTERAVRHGTTIPALYFNLGVIYAGKGRYEDAIRVMRDGLRLEPGRADILNSIGAFILRARKDCGEAVPYFTEAIRYDPLYAMAYLNAGECYASLGDTASMRYNLLRYAHLDPGGALRLNIYRRLNEQ